LHDVPQRRSLLAATRQRNPDRGHWRRGQIHCRLPVLLCTPRHPWTPHHRLLPIAGHWLYLQQPHSQPNKAGRLALVFAFIAASQDPHSTFFALRLVPLSTLTYHHPTPFRSFLVGCVCACGGEVGETQEKKSWEEVQQNLRVAFIFSTRCLSSSKRRRRASSCALRASRALKR